MKEQPKRNRQAVALRYEGSSSNAPRVLASGQGSLAEQIIAAARVAGVDIVEDPDLLEVLGRIPVGDEVPAELFEAVAEILAFLYRINGRYAVAQEDLAEE